MSKVKEQWIKGMPAFVPVLATALLVIIAGLGSVYLFAAGGSPDSPAAGDTAMSVSSQPLPEYVMASDANTQMAYQFAVDRPDVMMWMVCYCGCGDHSGHKSALNCFVKNGGKEFDDHGSACNVCVNIALAARSMTAEGRSLRDIRAYIDGKYSNIGPGTHTPLPPA